MNIKKIDYKLNQSRKRKLIRMESDFFLYFSINPKEVFRQI